MSQLFRLNDSTLPIRPWRWEDDMLEDQDEYCGQVSLKTDDDDDRRRRRKRSPDDDNNDNNNNFGNFDLSNMRNQFLSSAFNRARNKGRFPPTSAFQTMLSRTQMSDQLAELPSTSLGIQSEQQLPGSGLSEANIQNGGLSTDNGNLQSILSNIESDGETSTSGLFGNTDTNNGDRLNIGSFTSGLLPTASPDLLSSVRESLQNPTPTVAAVEALKTLLQERANNNNEGDNSDSNSASLNILNAITGVSGSGNPLIPSLENNNNNGDSVSGNQDSNSDTPKSSGSDGIDLSKLADMFKEDKQSSGDSNTKSDDSKSVIETLATSIIAPSIDPALLIPSVVDAGNIADKIETVSENSNENIAEILPKVGSIFVSSNLSPTMEILDKAMEKAVENVESATEKVQETLSTNIEENMNSALENIGDNTLIENVADILEKEKVQETLSTNIDDNLNSALENIVDNTLLGNVADTLENIKPDEPEIPPISIDGLTENTDNYVVDSIESIQESVANTLETLTENAGEKIVETLDNVGGGETDSIIESNPIETVLEKSEIDSISDSSPIETVIEKIAETIEEITPETTGMLPNIDDTLSTESDNLGVSDSSNIAVDVPNLEDIIESVSDNIEAVPDVSVPESVSDSLPESVSDMGEKLQDNTESISEFYENMQETINNVVEEASDDRTSFPTVPETENEAVSEATEQAIEQATELFENTQEMNTELPDIISQTIVSNIADNLEDVTEAIEEHTEDVSPPPMISTDDFPESVSESIQDAIEDAQETAGDIVEDRIEAIQEIVGGGENDVTTIGDSDLISDVVEQLTDVGDDTIVDRDDGPENGGVTESDVDTGVTDNVAEEMLDDFFGPFENENLEPETDREPDITESDVELPDVSDMTETLFDDVVDDIVENEIEDSNQKDDVDMTEHKLDVIDDVGGVETEAHDFDSIFDSFDDVVESILPETENDDILDTPEPQDTADDMIDDLVELSEDVIETARKAALAPTVRDSVMELSTCDTKLPSVCFSYEVEILDKGIYKSTQILYMPWYSNINSFKHVKSS